MSSEAETLSSQSTYSPINALSPEVLVVIFRSITSIPSFSELVCFYDETMDNPNPRGIKPGSQRILGAVCSHWRQVLYSSPELWTDIVLHMDYSSAKGECEAGQNYLTGLRLLLDRHLTNSGILSINLVATFPTGHVNYESIFADNFLPRVYPRARSLVLVNPFDSVLPCLADVNPQLVNVALIFAYRPPMSNDYYLFSEITLAAPLLKRFVLQTASGTHGHIGYFPADHLLPRAGVKLTLPWTSIAYFEVSHVSVLHCFEVLKDCPRLETFRVHSFPRRVLTGQEQLPLGIPLKFFGLKSFGWPMYELGNDIVQFLELVDLPALETFALFQFRPDGINEEGDIGRVHHWQTFFDKVSKGCLKAFELHSSDGHSMTIPYPSEFPTILH